MLGFVIQRLLQAVVVMFVISALVFVGVYAVGNPIDVLISPDATQAIREATIRAYGLDQPLWKQYLDFLGRLAQGRFRPLLRLRHAGAAAHPVAPAGDAGADSRRGGRRDADRRAARHVRGYKPDSPLSKAIMAISILGFSVPTFWIGLVLIFVFAVQFGWLPAGNRGPTRELFGVQWSILTTEGWTHLFLPALNLALFKFAMMVRLARAGTRELMLTDTVKFARAAGESEWTILRRHVLRLIAIPIVTVFGLEFGSTLAFAVVTETIFSWPGLGKLIIDSINTLDRPVMVAYLMLVAFFFILVNLLIDIAYAALDPRLRARRAAA